MSDSVGPHRRQPTRLPCPWDSPGKNTGVGCHFLLQCMKVESESEVTQSCLTLSDPMDCSLPGSSIHGIFQATVLEGGCHCLLHDSILKSRDITLPTKACLVKAMVFPVVMYGCESWTIKKAAAAAAKSLRSCPTLCDPMDCSPPGFSVHGISRQEHWSGLPFPSPMHESGK